MDFSGKLWVISVQQANPYSFLSKNRFKFLSFFPFVDLKTRMAQELGIIHPGHHWRQPDQ